MAQGTMKTVVVTSILGTMRVFVVLLAGFLASKWPKHEPLLTRETCRCVSRVCTLLFLPALMISSTGSTLTPAALRESWQLLATCSFTILVSSGTAWVFARVLLRTEDRHTFQPVHLAITFPNSAAFPLLLMASLCEQDNIKSDTDDDAAECFTKATGMIFIYVVVWQVWFYGWGFYSLEQSDALELKLTGARPSTSSPPMGNTSPELEVVDALAQTQFSEISNSGRSRVANDDGGVVAIDMRLGGEDSVASPTAQQSHVGRSTEGAKPIVKVDAASLVLLESGRAGQPDGACGCGKAGLGMAGPRQASADAEPCQAAPPSRCAAAEPEPSRRDKERASSGSTSDQQQAECIGYEGAGGSKLGGGGSNGGGRWQQARGRAWEVLVSPNIIAVAVGVVIAMIAPLKEMLFENAQAVLRPLGAAVQTVGMPTVAVSTLVMAGSLVQVPTVGGVTGRQGESVYTVPDWRRYRFLMGALHIVCRLIAVPAAGFAVFWLAKKKTSVMGENRLMHLVLLIEFAMPSAALIIVSLNQLRMPATAGFMARLYLWQYGASMFTISMWTALAVRMLVIVVLNQVRMTATAGFLSRLLVWQYGAVMFTVSVWTTLAVRMLY